VGISNTAATMEISVEFLLYHSWAYTQRNKSTYNRDIQHTYVYSSTIHSNQAMEAAKVPVN
jgi:hypothetical protein